MENAPRSCRFAADRRWSRYGGGTENTGGEASDQRIFFAFVRKRLVIATLVVAAIVTGFVLTSGPPPARPNPPGTFSLAVLGDAPYYGHEELQFRLVLKHIDAHDLSAVIHVGDIFWRPCS